MKVKMILPALTEAKSPFFRTIKYSLFPPLGLATLAGYLDDSDEASIEDEHVETLNLNDEPDLVVIQVYITSAYRAYQLANHYRDRFDDLRREESTSEQDVETARLNKIVCLDAFDLCKACKKDEDTVKQFLRKIK